MGDPAAAMDSVMKARKAAGMKGESHVPCCALSHKSRNVSRCALSHKTRNVSRCALSHKKRKQERLPLHPVYGSESFFASAEQCGGIGADTGMLFQCEILRTASPDIAC